MGVLSNLISREDLKPGDHIYTWRTAYTYAHHGIYVGDGRVIHFTRRAGQETGTILDRLQFSSSPVKSSISCENCGEQIRSDGVIISCVDCFLSGDNLYLFEYSVSTSFFLSKVRGGTCTLAPSDPPADVLHRANYLLRYGFGSYGLFKNNCEDFAIYCKTGLLVVSRYGVIGHSGQLNSIVAAGSIFAACSFVGISIAAAGGLYCLNRYRSDIGIRRDVQRIDVETLVLEMGVGQNEPVKQMEAVEAVDQMQSLQQSSVEPVTQMEVVEAVDEMQSLQQSSVEAVIQVEAVEAVDQTQSLQQSSVEPVIQMEAVEAVDQIQSLQQSSVEPVTQMEAVEDVDQIQSLQQSSVEPVIRMEAVEAVDQMQSLQQSSVESEIVVPSDALKREDDGKKTSQEAERGTAMGRLDRVREMLSNKISRDDLNPGDHIYSWRRAYMYAHHGIYIGEGMVIHFCNAEGEISNFSNQSISLCTICEARTADLGVTKSCLTCFLSGGDLYRFEYSATEITFRIKLRGFCTRASSDPPADVIDRAVCLLEMGFGTYNLFSKNCEDFAIYCKTSMLVKSGDTFGQSSQVQILKSVALTAAVPAIFKRLRGASMFQTGFSLIMAGWRYLEDRCNNDIGNRGERVSLEELPSHLQ